MCCIALLCDGIETPEYSLQLQISQNLRDSASVSALIFSTLEYIVLLMDLPTQHGTILVLFTMADRMRSRSSVWLSNARGAAT